MQYCLGNIKYGGLRNTLYCDVSSKSWFVSNICGWMHISFGFNSGIFVEGDVGYIIEIEKGGRY